MLKLGLALSLSTIKHMGAGWEPSDEARLNAWYKYNTGITLNGSDVSSWADQSSNGFDMNQATATEQPAFVSGYLNFNSGDTNNLQTSGQISLTGEFTIGIKFYPDAFNNTVIADNTTSNEFFKLTNSSRLAVNIDGSTKNAANLMTLYHNGVAQSATQTLGGTSDIDAIGVRKTDVNPYSGRIYEIQIFALSSADLTANVNNYLSSI